MFVLEIVLNLYQAGGLDGQICLDDSLIPGATPLVSFHHTGRCSHNKKPLAVTEGSVARIIGVVLRESGFIVEQNRSKNITLLYQSSTDTSDYRNVLPHQTLTQAPGYGAFTVKDNLARNVNQYQKNRPELNLIPKSYALPADYNRLVQDSQNYDGYYIVKKGASSRGRGIYLTKEVAQLSNSHGTVVQEYLSDPFLINGYKFDTRIYILITDVSPLVAYIYPEGLARFATEKYAAPAAENADHQRIHLTNFAVNSENHQIKKLDGAMDSKWSLTQLFEYLEKNPPTGFQGSEIRAYMWAQIKKTIANILLASQEDMLRRGGSFRDARYAGLYGADVIFDSKLEAKLLEINLQPALGTSTPLDLTVKTPLVRDTFHLSCIHHGEMSKDAEKKKLKNKVVIKTQDMVLEDRALILKLEEENTRRGRYERLLPACGYEYPVDNRLNRVAIDWACENV